MKSISRSRAKPQSAFAPNNNLADRIELWGFEGDFAIFTDGSLGFGLELNPLDVTCWTDAASNSLSERIAQFLNGIPTHTDIQFIQEIRGGNANTLDSHEALTVQEASATARQVCLGRTGRLRDLDALGLIPKHLLKVFVRRPIAKGLLGTQGIFSRSKLFPAITEVQLAREVAAATHLRTDIQNQLNSLGLNAKVMPSNEIIELIYRQWNPCRPIGLGVYDPEDIRSSILFTDVALTQNGFSLADLHYRVLSLKMLPDQTFATMAAGLRDLPFDSSLSLSIHVPDQVKELESLQSNRRVAYAMAHGRRSGVADLESGAKLQDIETLLSEIISQGERVFKSSLNIVLRSKSISDLETQVAAALSKVRELGGAEAMEESLVAFDIFGDTSIPNARARERIKRLKTSTLADLLPIYGPWTGHERPSLLLRSRMGSLVRFDPFSQDLTNYNQVVSGSSGGGKSFLTNVLLLQMLKEAPQIFIVDIGGSYQKLCDNLGGQYIPLSLGAASTINPFDLLPGETTPSSQKIKFLTALVELMTKEEGDKRLPRLEQAEIEEAIQKTYDCGKPPRLSVLRDILLAHNDLSIRQYGRILTQWCGNTPFGKFVDRETTMQLEKPIVAFDLKGMESHPDLQSVCLFIITDFIWREVQRDRSQKKFLVFDECWKLLESDAGATFIAEVFRTFRKYFASAIAISQNIDDFAKSKVAGAILSNSAIKWCLPQRGVDQGRLKEVLQLNENEVALIASLHQERGLYSEAFLMAQDNRTVVVIDSTPLEYWIATTDARDLAALDAERGQNQGEAEESLSILNRLADRYPRGVAVSEGVK